MTQPEVLKEFNEASLKIIKKELPEFDLVMGVAPFGFIQAPYVAQQTMNPFMPVFTDDVTFLDVYGKKVLLVTQSVDEFTYQGLENLIKNLKDSGVASVSVFSPIA